MKWVRIKILKQPTHYWKFKEDSICQILMDIAMLLCWETCVNILDQIFCEAMIYSGIQKSETTIFLLLSFLYYSYSIKWVAFKCIFLWIPFLLKI